jgi:hypothetical protein
VSVPMMPRRKSAAEAHSTAAAKIRMHFMIDSSVT